jgi:hypothetical protein
MKFLSAVAALTLLAAIGAAAQTTNALSDAEIQGRQLAQELLDQQPTENFTNTGVLQIRDKNNKQTKISLTSGVNITTTNWESCFIASWANRTECFYVLHEVGQNNIYAYFTSFYMPVNPMDIRSRLDPQQSSQVDVLKPFANSDFWLTDLGLEFLHWPGQKILRGDTARGRLCKVLESTNPNPSTNGYSRVLCWIDNETLGIVEAKAYDAQNKLLKEFYPKDIKKVDGQWQVGSMEIDNVQTGSRTRLEFDLKAK